MHSLCRKLLYSLPALLAGPGTVLVLLLLMPTLPTVGAVFIMLVVSAAVTLSVWASDAWQVPARSYLRRVRYLRIWLAYGVSYAGLVVTHAALLITLAWLSLFVPDTGSVHEATVIGIWFVAGISASLAAVHLVRAISPATDLKQYLWISFVLIAALAAADLGLPVLRADAVPLTLSKFSSLAEYAILAASLWIVVIVNDHATRVEPQTDLPRRSRLPVGGVRDVSRYGSSKDATASRSEDTAA